MVSVVKLVYLQVVIVGYSNIKFLREKAFAALTVTSNSSAPFDAKLWSILQSGQKKVYVWLKD